MKLTVPAPARWVNLNHRSGNRFADARDMEAWKDATRWQLRALPVMPFWTQPVEVICTVHKDSHRKYDAHNLAPVLKACIDALVAEGCVKDDDNEHVSFVGIRAGEVRKPAALVLEVTAA